MRGHQLGKTLPVGEYGLCFAEAYGDPRGVGGGRAAGAGVEIAGQVEVAFRLIESFALFETVVCYPSMDFAERSNRINVSDDGYVYLKH